MRKLVKRYQFGGTSTWSPYIIPQNNASNTYMGIMGIPDYSEQLKNFSSNLNRQTDNLINMYADAGDLFSQSLKIDKSNRPLDINKIVDLSSGVADILKSPSTGKSVSTDSLKKGMSAGAQKGLQIAGQIAGAVYDNIPSLDKVHNENDATTSELRGGINKTLMSGAAGPWGIVAGLGNTVIDKTGGFTDASQGLGKKNDTLNAIASLALPGAGWFTGKTIDYKVSDTLKQSGASYGGSLANAIKAEKNANAKILFGKDEANSMIASSKLEDIGVNNIMENAKLAWYGANNPLIAIRTQLQQNGGYQQNGTRTGKSGLKIDREFAKRVVKLSKGKKSKVQKIQEEVRAEEVAGFQKGGAVDGITGAAPKVTFESWYKTVPTDRNDTTSYNLRRAFELAPREELEAWRTSSISDLKNGKNHLNSVYLDPKTGVYEFMKAKNHPTLKYELEWFNSNDPEAVQFRNSYNLDDSGKYYRYVPKNPEKFKNGGAVNVIPDGALHKNKHHLENVDEKFEEVTAKGIPVITESAGGDITQHAEVEREEIIFNLDVTKRLEKLMEDGSDEAAIEAGKLLVHEILENTVDNTGLLNKIE